MDRLEDLARWAMFATYLFGLAALVWPAYVVKNLFRLLRGSRPFGAATALIALDQAIKIWAYGDLAHRDGPITLIPGVLDLRYAKNFGAAFSIMIGQTTVLVLMAVITVVIILVYTSVSQEDEPLTRTGLTLIFAGAVGNMLDRVIHQYVIDYVHVFWFTWDHWPIFNLADAMIDVGVGLLAIDFLIDAIRGRD